MTHVARLYDLVMTHKLDADDFFIHRVQELCARRNLNFFLVEPLWVEAFAEYLNKGEIRAKVLLNMHSEHHQPDEIYHRLVLLAHRKGVRVIDPPEVALAAFNKARVHARLAAAGLTVPHTIVVNREEISAFRLTDEARAGLGTPFVVKPAMGYGRRGVILNATSEVDLQRSADAWADESYLLQRFVTPHRIGEDPAYFRVYFVFGSVWISWWNCYTDRYRLVTEEEENRLGLGVMRGMIAAIAQVTGMQFFSSEFALTESNQFVVIDYVNDQCHLLTQTASPHNGVPDGLVTAIAERLVDGAQQLMREPSPSFPPSP
ncbi:MAG: hypothetical protein AB1705_13180 [Verrucomicrobiota bacterium]